MIEPTLERFDLMCVVKWLEAGCDPKEAAKELRGYQPKLAALLSRLDKAEAGWQVKPLDWTQPYPLEGTFYAESLLGVWSVWEIGSGYVRAPDQRAGRKVDGDIEAAKAAAQADYEDQLRSAFLPPPPSES